MNRLMKWASLIAISVQSALGLQEKPIRKDDANSTQLIAVGLTGNNLYSLLLAESDDGGNNWILPNVTGAPDFAFLKSASSVFTDEGAAAIAVGGDLTGYHPPLLIQKREGGNWARVNISGLDSTGEFISSSCAAINSSDICVAVGQYFNESAVLAHGINGNWSLSTIPQQAAPLYSVSCTVNSQNIECFAAGNAIFQSTNGQAWKQAFADEAMYLYAIGCNSGNAGISCVAAGAGLVESNTAGQWKTIQVPEGTIFESVSCVGVNKTCLAVGYGEFLTNPIIAQGLNGQWSLQTSIPGVQEGVMSGASCIDDGSENGFCVAVGAEVGNIWPIIAEWSNGNWTFPNATVPGGLNSVNCFMTGPDTKKCIAGGYGGTGPHYPDNPPFLIERNEAGNWTAISNLNVPSPGQYWSTTALVFAQPARERNYRVGKTLELA